MKKTAIIVVVLLIIAYLGYSIFIGRYNTMVEMDENVKTVWSNVETQYQRRADLIPNLVNTVKGFAEQEKEVLVGVTEARSKASSIQIDPTNLNAQNMAQFQQAQDQLSGALSRLLVTVEKYPELKSDQNFRDLQAQLEGTENRIAVARDRYNESVKEYNTFIRKFPANISAWIFDFEEKTQFAASEGSENAPTVSF